MTDITIERLANLGRLIGQCNRRIDATAHVSELGITITLRDSALEMKRVVAWHDIELNIIDPLSYRFNEIFLKMSNAREREGRLWE